MKIKKAISVLLIIAIIVNFFPTRIFGVDTLKLTITPNITEAHPGDEILYTVKMSAVQNLAGMKFKIVVPDGLTFVEGKVTDNLQTILNAAKAEFTEATKIFVVGSSNYSSSNETTLMTFKCSVDEEATGDKEITFDIDEDDIFDTTLEMNNIPVNYLNTGSTVSITPKPIPSTSIILNKNTLTLEVDATETLVATISPANSTDTISWESSDSLKASVDSNGKVTAIAEGNATIMVKTSSDKMDICEVTVIKATCKHQNKTTIPYKKPTCTVPGNNEYRVCDDCGKLFKANGIDETTYEEEKISALEHDFIIPRSDADYHWNECSRCGDVDMKINHLGEGEYQNDGTNHWKLCECGAKVNVEIHEESNVVKENVHNATCIVNGSYDEVVYCSVCNYEMSRTPKIEDAKGHTAGAIVKENINPKTCNNDGTYDEVVYCTECNAEMSRTQITEKTNGHTKGSAVQENVVPATHTTKGSYDEVIYCTVCNYEISRISKEIEMISHDTTGVSWSSDETSHWKECGCGTKVEIGNHVEGNTVKENINPATCSQNGTYDEVVYCSVCNYEMSRIQKNELAKEHTKGKTVNENIVLATCVDNGSHDEVIYCTVCSFEISRVSKIDKATGHTYGTPVQENLIPAQCTQNGSYDEVIYCEECNKKLKITPKVISAKGHTEGTVVIENEIEATIDKEGSYDEVVYCVDCEKELKRLKKTTPKFVYEVLDETEYINEEGSGTITIRVNGKIEKFEGISVDGKNVDPKYYTVKSGSTIVTLSEEYLSTLSKGPHKIVFLYDDGKVETTFKVVEKTNNTGATTQNNNSNVPSTPKTDDVSNMPLWIIGLIISEILFVLVLVCKIRKRIKEGR